MYGALEFCVTQGSQLFIAYACGLNVQHRHLEVSFNAVALDPEFSSLQDRGEKSKWKARRTVLDRFRSAEPLQVSETVFGTFLQNIWPKTIEEVFACFCIDAPPTSQARHIGYIKELVEKRNAIAHGRETASEAAEGRTSAELEILMDAIYEVCVYFLDTLSNHATSLRFVRQEERATYSAI